MMSSRFIERDAAQDVQTNPESRIVPWDISACYYHDVTSCEASFKVGYQRRNLPPLTAFGEACAQETGTSTCMTRYWLNNRHGSRVVGMAKYWYLVSKHSWFAVLVSSFIARAICRNFLSGCGGRSDLGLFKTQRLPPAALMRKNWRLGAYSTVLYYYL